MAALPPHPRTSSLPVALWENILKYAPQNIHCIARLSKEGRSASQGTSLFMSQYFRDLRALVSQETLCHLITPANWTPSLGLLQELSQTAFRRARTIYGGIERLARETMGIMSPTHLADIAKWIQEEDRNLVSIAPRILRDWDTENARMIRENPGKNEAQLISIKAQFIRHRINASTLEERSKLHHLNLSGLSLSSIPKDVFLFPNLKHLDLSNNQITDIPSEIGVLRNLTTLHLGYNKIAMIPLELSSLSNLESLHLNNNEIRSLPTQLRALTKLHCLNVNHNQIETIPLELAEIPNLNSFHLHGNRIAVVPPQFQEFVMYGFLVA